MLGPSVVIVILVEFNCHKPRLISQTNPSLQLSLLQFVFQFHSDLLVEDLENYFTNRLSLTPVKLYMNQIIISL